MSEQATPHSSSTAPVITSPKILPFPKTSPSSACRPTRLNSTRSKTFGNIFADHHPFSEGGIASLVAQASREGLTLVTTEKDFVRLRAMPGAETVAPFAVTMEFDDPATLRTFVTDRLFKAAWGVP
jgi:hypothetical protein